MKIILGLFLCLVFNSSGSSQSKEQLIPPAIFDYQGLLESGVSYQAKVEFDKKWGLSLTTPLIVPRHYAFRTEWINLKSFPELTKLRRHAKKQIVLKVISNEISQITVNRWNMTIHCQIIRVE